MGQSIECQLNIQNVNLCCTIFHNNFWKIQIRNWLFWLVLRFIDFLGAFFDQLLKAFWKAPFKSPHQVSFIKPQAISKKKKKILKCSVKYRASYLQKKHPQLSKKSLTFQESLQVNKRMFLLNTFLRKVEFNFKCKSCKCWMNIWNFHFLDCINFLSQVKREDFFLVYLLEDL